MPELSSIHHVLETKEENKYHSLADKIFENTGVLIERCYQCGKCTASCPLASEMEHPPSHLLRMLQYETPEMDDKVLRSQTVWFCVTCEMCQSRCPQDVDLPIVMPYLKRESLREKKVNPKSKDIVTFHQTFCETVNWTGRLFDFGFILDYNIRSGNFLHDAKFAPKLYLKGKLRLLPEFIKDRKGIKNIFRKTKHTVEKDLKV